MGGEPERDPEVSGRHLLAVLDLVLHFFSFPLLINFLIPSIPSSSILKGTVHLRACTGCGSPEHHTVAQVCRDGDEESAGEPRPQHLGQSHHHTAPSQPVLVGLGTIFPSLLEKLNTTTGS